MARRGPDPGRGPPRLGRLAPRRGAARAGGQHLPPSAPGRGRAACGRARRAFPAVVQWAEAGLLAEIESAVPGEPRTAAALLGVTEPTLLRRRAELSRHF